VGALAMLSVPAYVSFTPLWGRAGAVMFVFGYSGLMEVLQHFSPGRTGSWEDLGMNGVGVLIGVGLAKWAMMRAV
jgi:VanZ family protein